MNIKNLLEKKQLKKKKINNIDIKFDQIIFDVPVGERILISDSKPSGLKMSHAINTKRNSGLKIDIKVDKNI